MSDARNTSGISTLVPKKMKFNRKGNKFVVMKKMDNESDASFCERAHFIYEQNVKNEKELTEAITYSKIYMYHNLEQGCIYDDETMKKLSFRLSSFYDESENKLNDDQC